ncbi:ommochrome-binding protein-like [Anticarsia gemmatalis]|uniref:ommochrome-binding protein-like n=1 Tax=Anticarsia gemmatalis TaxID=129554 RepID=UPI003F75CBB8
MKIFFAVTLLAFAEAGLAKSKLKCVTIGTNVYEEEILIKDLPSPFHMTIDYDTNTLFVSYSYSLFIPFKILYLSLKDHDYALVDGIKIGFVTAVDDNSHTVYLGASDGLFTFNYNTKNATRIASSPDLSIWQMFYKDGLYLTTYPNQKVYLYKNGEFTEVPEFKEIKVKILAVKNNGDYVYFNSSGLFTYDKTLKKSVFLGDYVVNQFTANIGGDLYFSTPRGIFYIDDKKGVIKSLAIFEKATLGVSIDGTGAIIYGTDNSVRRITPSKSDCTVNLTEHNI